MPLSNSIPILMYHAIAPVACALEAAYTTPPAVFEAQMRALRAAGLTGVTVSELVARWERGEPPDPDWIAISVDDGFACAHDTAWPILRTHGHRATVYAISGYLDRMGRFDTDLGIAARPVLSRSALRDLHQSGIEVGSHSVNHCDLRQLSPSALLNELHRSRATLQDLLGAAVPAFAYPRGLFDRRVRQAVIDTGYRSACATAPGLACATTDRHALRRVQIGDDPDPARFIARLRWGGPPLQLARQAVRDGLIAVMAPLLGADPLDCRTQSLRRALRRAPAP